MGKNVIRLSRRVIGPQALFLFWAVGGIRKSHAAMFYMINQLSNGIIWNIRTELPSNAYYKNRPQHRPERMSEECHVRKRGTFVLAGLLVLLTACAQLPAEDASIQTAGGSAMASGEAAQEAPGPGATESGGVVLPNGPVPQSEYAAPSPPARFYEDVTLELVPRDDYGRIWPYLGGHLTMMWMQGELYGLCDEAGRILCDPVFNRAEILEKDGHRLYKLTKYGHDENYKDTSKITLAKLDGSWAREYDDVETVCHSTEFAQEQALQWREDVVYDYIAVCLGGKWGVIDYEGNEVLPCVYSAPVCFSEGVASVLSDDGGTFSFIDATGAVVLGPFGTPPAQISFYEMGGDAALPLNYGLIFCEGRVRFYEDGKYGVVGRDGNVVVPAQYDFISSYADGTAEFLTSGGPDGRSLAGVLGPEGEVLLEPTDVWFYKTGDGTVLLQESTGPVSLDLFTGERAPWSGSGAPSYMCDSTGVYITWAGGGLDVPGAACVALLENGNFALTLKGGRETWIIADRSGKTVAGPFDGRANSAVGGLIQVYLGEPYDPSTGEYWTTLYDETGRRLLDGEYLMILPFDGRYLVRTDTAAGLLDENGGWVIKAPLYDYLND